MTHPLTSRTAVSSLTPTTTYAQERRHLFPTDESIRWFVRRHKLELIQAGALLMVSGRWLADPAILDEKVVEIGRRIAERGY